jgi:CheY-like chemotaxis protein
MAKVKLLFCDDDADQLHWLEKSFLSADGHDVYCAHDGKEALEIYEAAGPFDAVITDYQMPKMNGVELILAIRQICPTQHCVVQTSERGVLLPGVPQLHKPYGLRQLLLALRAPVQSLLF